MSEAPYRSAEWWNERLENSVERAWPAVEGWAKQYLAAGLGVGYLEIQWEDLQAMPKTQALIVVAKMMMQPLTRADGIKFARKILETLPQQSEAMI